MTAPNQTLKTLPELIALPAPHAGSWHVGNPFTRTWALAETAFLDLLSQFTEPRTVGGLPTALADRGFRVADASRSPFADGLLGDPTGLDREVSYDASESLGVDDAVALAARLHLLVADDEAYEEYLHGQRLGLLDRAHRGDMHQQVGEYVMLGLRERSVDSWWVDQKFTEDRLLPREGLYRDAQWRFATSYWTAERLDGARVLDFGCGPGLFTRLFASRGATVLGLDTNEEHVESARELVAADGLGERVDLQKLELPADRTLGELDEGAFDLVFLSDVLMFYFHPYDEETTIPPAALLDTLRRLLAPGGTITILEPNGVFWQQPWLGSPRRPVTVLTEYRRRSYGVTPTLEELSRAAEQAGLVVSRLREVGVGDGDEPSQEEGGRAGARAISFAAEFPPWWLVELRPAYDEPRGR